MKESKEDKEEVKLHEEDFGVWFEQAFCENDAELKVYEDDNRLRLCEKKLICGHSCYGVHGAQNCLPCMESDCSEAGKAATTKDELCAICYTTELGSDPCVMLGCGHLFHVDCVG